MALFVGITRVLSRVCALERQTLASCTSKLLSSGQPQAVDSDQPCANMTNPYEKKRESCILCKLALKPSYKNVKLLSQFISPYTGLVYPRNITRLCYYQQEHVVREIERARRAGLMSRFIKEPDYFKDPPLFDPARPVRPHRF